MRAACNKGVYGEKRKSFLSSGVAICNNHGLHDKWYYNKSHNQLSCKLCLKDRQKKYKSKEDHVFARFIIYSKSRCKKWAASGREVEHNISLDYIIKLYIKQKGTCAISGLDLDEDVMSLDRIDSALGYVEGNVQWVHFDINRMKSDFSEQYFKHLCQAVTNKK